MASIFQITPYPPENFIYRHDCFNPDSSLLLSLSISVLELFILHSKTPEIINTSIQAFNYLTETLKNTHFEANTDSFLEYFNFIRNQKCRADSFYYIQHYLGIEQKYFPDIFENFFRYLFAYLLQRDVNEINKLLSGINPDGYELAMNEFSSYLDINIYLYLGSEIKKFPCKGKPNRPIVFLQKIESSFAALYPEEIWKAIYDEEYPEESLKTFPFISINSNENNIEFSQGKFTQEEQGSSKSPKKIRIKNKIQFKKQQIYKERLDKSRLKIISRYKPTKKILQTQQESLNPSTLIYPSNSHHGLQFPPALNHSNYAGLQLPPALNHFSIVPSNQLNPIPPYHPSSPPHLDTYYQMNLPDNNK